MFFGEVRCNLHQIFKNVSNGFRHGLRFNPLYLGVFNTLNSRLEIRLLLNERQHLYTVHTLNNG